MGVNRFQSRTFSRLFRCNKTLRLFIVPFFRLTIVVKYGEVLITLLIEICSYLLLNRVWEVIIWRVWF